MAWKAGSKLTMKKCLYKTIYYRHLAGADHLILFPGNSSTYAPRLCERRASIKDTTDRNIDYQISIGCQVISYYNHCLFLILWNRHLIFKQTIMLFLLPYKYTIRWLKYINFFIQEPRFCHSITNSDLLLFILMSKSERRAVEYFNSFIPNKYWDEFIWGNIQTNVKCEYAQIQTFDLVSGR